MFHVLQNLPHRLGTLSVFFSFSFTFEKNSSLSSPYPKIWDGSMTLRLSADDLGRGELAYDGLCCYSNAKQICLCRPASTIHLRTILMTSLMAPLIITTSSQRSTVRKKHSLKSLNNNQVPQSLSTLRHTGRYDQSIPFTNTIARSSKSTSQQTWTASKLTEAVEQWLWSFRTER